MDKEGIYQGGTQKVIPRAAQAGKATGGSLFEPMNLLRMVLRRWMTVALLTLFGGLAGVFVAQHATRTYVAKAELEMSVRRPKVINNEAVYDDSTARDEGVIFNTRFKKFKSPAMERLATQEYFKRYPEDEQSKGGTIGKYTLATLIRDVNWYKDPSANIVYVSYLSTNPEFAAKLVNVLSHCAGLLMMQENQTMSDEAVKWLITQLDDQRDELEEVELQLAGIRDELQLGSLEQRKEAQSQALVAVSGEREGLVSTLASRETVYGFVMELNGTDPNLEILPTGLPKEEQLNELIGTWRSAHDELLSVASRYTDIHPEYKAAEDKEARAKNRLEQFIDMSAKAVQNEIDLLGKQLKQVDERIVKIEREILDLEQQIVSGNQKLQRLERKRDAADNAYQSMLRRMEEARLSADENMAFTKIIRNAEVPRIPESPSKKKIVATGIFFGGAAGCALVLLLSIFGDKIESVTDLKSLGLHILGTLPTHKKVDSRSELATIGLRDKFCHMIEIFAGVNALISSNKYAEKTKVLLVNSAMPGEGKTVASCNLAISAAMNGSRTLLIDGDLRRPQLAKVFAIGEDHPSLLEWLVDGDSLMGHRDLVSHGVIENLDVVTSRPIKEINPAELLGRGRLSELLDWARVHYDRIIIDSPPLGAVGDAQVLANLSDAIIIVSRIGKTRRRTLKFVLAKFEEIDALVFGCIANDVPHSISGMFQGAEGYGYTSKYGAYKPYGGE
ncbi:Putative tyrosine-protein kinase in cps region [Pontiella desulfatans]|uniref:non-specific protein-tyrosine kinase n=1 Tax=Pontiella desulfatans TaxID=2750659 RepID=A0A6C2U416_PONDE|nr:polysaccharide biosynthesis tyrosine autokinase [Pontiella desulfatans]VGO14798.1 Putative tyrosine-protein kinase in cps region [Pontiella desulfatans]